MINKLPQAAASVRAAGSLALKNNNMPYTAVTACNASARRLEQCHAMLAGIDTVIDGWLHHGHDAEDAMKMIAEILDDNDEPEWD